MSEAARTNFLLVTPRNPERAKRNSPLCRRKATEFGIAESEINYNHTAISADADVDADAYDYAAADDVNDDYVALDGMERARRARGIPIGGEFDGSKPLVELTSLAR